MPYTFRDTNSAAANYMLPSEALKINGDYIEELFDEDLTLSASYQTLNVQGRELSAQEAEDIEVGVRHGSFLSSRKFKPRELHITYKLEASSNEHFRKAFNKLNEVLNVKDAELIFADEPDKFFIGTVTEVGEIEPGRNAVVGEFTITCFDPFKYSVEEYVVEADENNEMTAHYGGTIPASPKFDVEFYSSDDPDDSNGECGYVALMNDRSAALQFGDPMQADEIERTVKEITEITTVTTSVIRKAKQLLTEEFGALNGWTVNGGLVETSTSKAVGSVVFRTINDGGVKVNDCSAIPNSYVASGASDSSYAGWHGPTLTKAIPNNTGGTRSANGTFFCMLKCCCPVPQAQAWVTNAVGLFQVHLKDANNREIASVAVMKNPGGPACGEIILYVDYKEVKRFSNVDMGINSPNFGMNGASRIQIKKTEGRISFEVGEHSYSYTNDAVKNSIPSRITFHMAKWKNHYPLVIGIHNCKYIDDSVGITVSTARTDQNIKYLTEIIDIKNTFGTNDKLVVDTADASIRKVDVQSDLATMTGGLSPELGALGNQWEAFTLEPGTNQLKFAYSDWVDDEFAPSVRMRYREVFV